MKVDNSLASRLSISLCALVAIVPFLWDQQALTASVIYKQLAIESASMMFAVLCFYCYFRKKSTFEMIVPAIAWPMAGCYLMAVVSVLWAVDVGASVIQLIHMFGLFVLFALVVYTAYMRPGNFPVLLVRTCIAAAVALSLFGLLQNFGYLEDVFYQAAAPAASMVNRNVLAQYLGTMLFPALLMIFWSVNRREVLLSSFAFSILLAVFLLTYTRGAWMGGLVGLMVLFAYIISHSRVRKYFFDDPLIRLKCVATGLALMAAFIVMSLPSPVNHDTLQRKVFDALEQPEDGSSALRRALYANSWEIFLAHPLGIGIGNWRNIYPEYHQAIRKTPGFGLNMQPRNLHSNPYQFLIETGVFGALFALSVLILLTWTVWMMLSCRVYSRQQHMLLLSLFLALIGVSVHSLVSFPFDSPASAMQIWIWLGLIGGLSLCYANQRAEEQQSGGGLLVCAIRLNRTHAGVLLAMFLTGLLAMFWYQYASIHGAELEEKAEILYQHKKCTESLPYIDASVASFQYAYTATMRRSMYHEACDPDRANAFRISLELLNREPYYLHLLIYMLPSALENRRLDVVADVAARLVRVFPDLPDGYHWQGMLAGGKGDYKKARRLFTQALQKDADFQPSKEMLDKM